MDEELDRTSIPVGLAWKRDGALRQDDAWKHAGRPNMHGLTDIDRFVQRAALDAHYVGSAAAPVPESRAARRAKSTVESMSRIGGSRPDFRLPLGDAQRGQRDDKGNSESRCGLLAALLAMAYVKLQGTGGQRIADRAALAPSETIFVSVWHGVVSLVDASGPVKMDPRGSLG